MDAVVGTGELEKILAAAGVAQAPRTPSPFNILTSSQNSSRPEGDHRRQQGRFARDTWDGAVADLPNYLYDDHTPRVLTTPAHSAYIKIAEGCDHPCTFCIIPQLRGQFRSRRFESVIAEAERLAQSGVREITLIGQDTTCYGEDLGSERWPGPACWKSSQASKACSGFASSTPIPTKSREDCWRQSPPTTIFVRTLMCRCNTPRLTVLKRMKRGGGADLFLRSIEKMRRVIPGVTLRTSFIVGFPGETEEFEELCGFVKEAAFDWMGAFGYSDQEGAGAFDHDKKLSPREIESRRKSLMSIQKKISRRRRNR